MEGKSTLQAEKRKYPNAVKGNTMKQRKRMDVPGPRIAAIHDLAGFGRCSLCVVMPALSSMGTQVIPLPTALLSTHTGGFTGYTFLDLTEEMRKIAAHWSSLPLEFEAIYSGFLGNLEQICIVEEFIHRFRRDGAPVFVDPVMGDDGVLYATYTEEMRAAMKDLVRQADVICPNITEAFFLLDRPYENIALLHPREMRECVDCMLHDLAGYGPEKVVITGIETAGENGTPLIGTACLREKDVLPEFYMTPKVEVSYPGTGDLFASVLLGYLVRGRALKEAAAAAVGFVHLIVEETLRYAPQPRDGVIFEKYLYRLHEEPSAFFDKVKICRFDRY